MRGPIERYLASDHYRLDRLLKQALLDPGVVDNSAYDGFRRGLLRHIGMEEKVLLLFARQQRGGQPLSATEQLKRDHAALAALLVPSPRPEPLETVREILREHNPLEEGLAVSTKRATHSKRRRPGCG